MAQFFSVLTLICIIGYFACTFYAQYATRKKYGNVSNAVSDYGAGESRGVFQVMGAFLA